MIALTFQQVASYAAAAAAALTAFCVCVLSVSVCLHSAVARSDVCWASEWHHYLHDALRCDLLICFGQYEDY